VLGIALAYRSSVIEVTLEAQDSQRMLRTRAGTVADLLLAHDIEIAPGDLVSPALDARLRGGDTVTIQAGRPIRVRVDGEVRRLRSHAKTPHALLGALDIALDGRDVVVVDGQPWQADQPWPAAPPDSEDTAAAGADFLVADAAAVAHTLPRLPSPARAPEPEPSAARLAAASAAPALEPGLLTIDVLRSAPVTVIEDGIPFAMALAGPTVGLALHRAGVHLWPEDVVRPARDAHLAYGARVTIHRATPFTLQADGETREVRARAETVGDALKRVGVALKGRDYAIPRAETPLGEGSVVQVVRVVEDYLIQQLAIPFTTLTEPDSQLPLDEHRVTSPGVAGQKTQRIRITYEDGEETGRELVEETIDSEPIAERVAYGTKIVWRTIDTPEGPKRYWRHLRTLATSYSASRAGTPTWVPWFGRTRLGWVMRKGIVAVDPRFVPLRTNLFVPGYGVGVAGDTGGRIRGYHIDLGYDDDNYKRWRQWVDLYLLEPLPPESQIQWLLP
jgi:uncharacterized protein YabE (DUF348 family)